MPPQDTFRARDPAPLPVFRPPLQAPDTPIREIPEISFADLVRMLAEGVADAQASVDRTAADMAVQLAATKVKIVPRITETIDEAGGVHFEQAPAQEVSLLDLGLMPTFYQFSQATLEVVMDLKIVENEKETGEEKKRFGLFANTSSVRLERQLNREVKVASKLTATLVPVPRPLRLDPARSIRTSET